MQSEELNQIRTEIEISFALSEDYHDLPDSGLVKVYDVFEDNTTVTIVMEYIQGISMFEWLLKYHKTTNYSEAVSMQVFKSVCEGLNRVHYLGIAHRDIKPDNILMVRTLDGQWTTKLIDFGLSAVLMQGQTANQTVGSIAYLSPEIVANRDHDHQTDMWSMGIVLYTLLTGRMVFVDPDIKKTMSNIKYRQLNFTQAFWEGKSAQCIDIVTRLLEKDPKKRLTCE